MTPNDFCARAKSLIGRPYSEIDCIGVVRVAAGIRCQGTNWLWRSYNNAGKYRYLSIRMDRSPTMKEARNGMLVFRIKWEQIPNGYTDKPNCHHVGVITDDMVIQSNPSSGVTISAYNPDQWDGCGWLKQIDYVQDPAPEPDDDDLIDLDPIDTHPSLYDMICAIYDRICID
jgi:hypothetical protein